MITVNIPNHGPYEIKRLLGTNKKLDKSNYVQAKYQTIGLSLAPNKVSGYQTCPDATPGCIASCIFTSGMAQSFKTVNRARVAKTIAFFEQRKDFLEMLMQELQAEENRAIANGAKLTCRLNVFSDVPWEKLAPQIFKEFPKVQFYDYTKSFKRMMNFTSGKFPKNYHLTFSRSELNDEDCKKVLKAGGNVAVVYGLTPTQWKTYRPKKWNGFTVLDGDEHDLRFLNKSGSVVGLYAKGSGRKDKSGFVVRLSTGLPMAKP